MSSSNDFGITFDLPKNQSNVIKVIGVGGGGSNAINHMFKQGIKGVDFVICNTDSQALNNSGVPNKIQLGVHLTEGLGAGANPEIGEQSAVESLEDIRAMLTTNTKMVFITAGMGGGTGTGAAPIIAKMAKELDILTVGIVTMPFEFEGKIRNAQAHQGIEKFRKTVDSLVIINNNKLREVYGNLGFKAGFSKADEVLSTAARGIAEVITHHYLQNIDLRDAKTVLSNSGTAIMGSSSASGQNRAQEAITNALDSPLLNDNKITGAKNVLLLIVSGAQEITIDEIGEINDHIQAEAGFGANIIMGVGEDETLGDAVSVTIIATGFDVDQQNDITNTEVKKVVHALEDEQKMVHDLMPVDPVSTPSKPKQPVSETTVIHTLEEEEDEEAITAVETQAFSDSDLISTTAAIRDLDVDCEVMNSEEPEDDFIINEVTSLQPEAHDIEAVQDDQTMLTFDLPISNQSTLSESEEVEVFTLEDATVNSIEVNDYIELIPVTEANDEGETRYVLDDHIVLEQTGEKYEGEKQSAEAGVDVDEEMTFTKVTVKERAVTKAPEETTDPYNSPISTSLRERADERRKKMKAFNYKFNTSKIDDIEKEPAYKRQGVNLNDVAHSSDVQSSRTTIGLDDNDEVQLRSNNSYLHDNVD
ncbi:cell division protein FtsZ [Flavobacteriaceae bacterium]|jgi:cell division protein FtsZ|nr:cell division protein FtsZ [Flavobacteriaceae bacterium]